MNKNLFTLLLAVTLLAGALTGCGAGKTESAESAGPAQGTAAQAAESGSAPELASFTAKTLDGADYTQADLAGADVTMINIWSTGCGPCINEMPELAAFAKTLPERIKLITYCGDGEEYASYAKEILDQSGFTGATLISGDGDLEKLLLSVQYTPTTVFVDGSGRLVGTAVIGAPENVAEGYTAAINEALAAAGKEPLA